MGKKTEAPIVITLVFLLTGGLVIASLSVNAEEDDDNDDNDDPEEFSELVVTGLVQEENVQGHTITGSVEK
jgi:hypothetical protein